MRLNSFARKFAAERGSLDSEICLIMVKSADFDPLNRFIVGEQAFIQKAHPHLSQLKWAFTDAEIGIVTAEFIAA